MISGLTLIPPTSSSKNVINPAAESGGGDLSLSRFLDLLFAIPHPLALLRRNV